VQQQQYRVFMCVGVGGKPDPYRQQHVTWPCSLTLQDPLQVLEHASLCQSLLLLLLLRHY